MAERAPRSTRLKFKGDKAKKKRKHGEDDGGDGGGGSSKQRRRRDRDNADDAPDDIWVMPENPNEIRGPTFIFHPSDPAPICISFDATRGKVVLNTLDKHKDGENADGEEEARNQPLISKTPTDVSQVWVTTRVAGSPTINLRTGAGDGKFLSCDTHGLVSAFREARGPQEEWTPVVLPEGMVAFMNVYEKYLGVDEVAGGQLALRGDSDQVGFNERFWVKIQNKYKKEANEEERKKKEGLAAKSKIDEAATKCVFSLKIYLAFRIHSP